MRCEIVIKSDNIFVFPVRRDQERLQVRVHKLKWFGGTSFILRESSIGHFAKSTSRANTVLRREVDLGEAQRMLLCSTEYVLQGVPKSPVHNVVIDFAHGGDKVRSNCWDRSNPKNNTTFVFRVWSEPKTVGLAS